ncbi:MAG: transposase [Francisellaceae bacterium]|nr:transposase [Francisellaceae bacterium]
MPYKLRASCNHKFNKAQYKVKNWKEYEQGLKNRSNLCFWFSAEAIENWYDVSTITTRGRQTKYSNLAIETGLIIKAVFKLPYRALEGFLSSVCQLMNIRIDIPDHTSFSRRAQSLKVSKLSSLNSNAKLNVIVDGTGVKIVGTGEWQALKNAVSKRKSWRKLHLMMDEKTGQIISNELSTEEVSDDAMIGALLKPITHKIKSLKADRAYDTERVYKDIAENSNNPKCSIIIPPRTNAKRSCLFKIYLNKREINTREWFQLGPYKWQNKLGYNKRILVETLMFCYKKLIGPQLYSRLFSSQSTETKIGCLVLNKMLELGKPRSIKI